MPFIWNNIDYLVLDEQEEYDKSQYKVVRKLFVAPNTSNIEVSISSVS